MNEHRIYRLLVVLCGLLIATPLTAQSSAARWPYEVQLGQFTVHSDFDAAADSQLREQLGSLQQDVAQTLSIQIHREPIHIILFNDQSTYRSYMRLHFPDVPFRRALFIKRRGPGMVFAYRSDQMLIDLRHETTHALLNASLPYVPLWLDEGLAEYFESVPTTDGQRPHPHRGSAKRTAFWGRVPSVESLEAIEDLSAMGGREYQKSWSWVHFLLHGGEDTRAVMIRFLQELQAHSPPGQLSRRIAAELPDWKSRYLAHFRG